MVTNSKSRILTINGGSSSIRFSLYHAGESLERILSGKIDRIGLDETTLTFNNSAGNQQGSCRLDALDQASAATFLLKWLEEQAGFEEVKAIGHRVVHGMQHTAPEVVTEELLAELHRISPCDPQHLPGEIELIETFRQSHPGIPQVACFDTAFHRTMPRVAKILPLPRRFDAQGVQRYGFHGLSYEYLMDTLVFAGGIGENAPVVRTRICDGLGFLGIELNESRNAATAEVISADAGHVTVRVIRTDEELMIARMVCRVPGIGSTNAEGTNDER